MKTYKAICIKNYLIKDGDVEFKLERGKEYLIATTENKTVTVLSRYWASGVPTNIFTGKRVFTK